MADESCTSPSTSAANATGRATSLTGNEPPSFSLRRAATVGQSAPMRRRSTVNTGSPSAAENGFADVRRRSSTYSDFSLNDARRDLETSADEILNPSKSGSKQGETSPYVYVPLTLALLPAIAGIFFENGSAFFTDLILLSLAAVFLHWSVTQPWDWYRSAQEIRIVRDEIMTEAVFESDSDVEPPTTLENVPEEASKKDESGEATEGASERRSRQWKERQHAALRELYFHEMAALAWCFIFPLLGAYLLHTIRGQLTRRSEGLVSDYNLTIFLCAAEIRPVSHLIRMLQHRTLRIQQIVAKNPHEKRSVTTEEFKALSARLDELEAQGVTSDTNSNTTVRPDVPQSKAIQTAVAQEVRSSIQPELDALNRAMRRYEKKLTLLACQTDNRIEYVDYRLNDAIALAAVAAKNSNAQWNLGVWFMDKTIALITLPFHALVAVSTFPFRTISAMLSRKSRSSSEKAQRTIRNGKAVAQGRVGSDRMPARVSRR
ncbi:uncharacterized protein F4812DRAFT_432066 [Daldinia caldariorum]|uniref:uncharacterized protein n=1 Tax=Daldinia caldariorum TaxID=326644 RepID=UPI002008B526|nr:uncharacterized protein F4812DRAFT_432066 [Daldinia caldariorum]KAI1467296.1 hypothetical protein F4812DRAFT_432066 [Daldinia caldariorum]